MYVIYVFMSIMDLTYMCIYNHVCCFALNVYSSASKVNSKTYGSNEKLAQLRADNFVNTIKSQIDPILISSGKVKIEITSVTVDGPSYNGDAKNKSKYKPYQFVAFKTE